MIHSNAPLIFSDRGGGESGAPHALIAAILTALAALFVQILDVACRVIDVLCVDDFRGSVLDQQIRSKSVIAHRARGVGLVFVMTILVLVLEARFIVALVAHAVDGRRVKRCVLDRELLRADVAFAVCRHKKDYTRIQGSLQGATQNIFYSLCQQSEFSSSTSHSPSRMIRSLQQSL